MSTTTSIKRQKAPSCTIECHACHHESRFDDAFEPAREPFKCLNCGAVPSSSAVFHSDQPLWLISSIAQVPAGNNYHFGFLCCSCGHAESVANPSTLTTEKLDIEPEPETWRKKISSVLHWTSTAKIQKKRSAMVDFTKEFCRNCRHRVCKGCCKYARIPQEAGDEDDFEVIDINT